MGTGHRDRTRKKSVRSLLGTISEFATWAAPAAIVASVVYFGVLEPAHSQIESRKQSSSFVSSGLTSDKPLLPKAPAQVELPAPPPMKIMPGLAEPLLATGPVTDEEGKDLDAALKEFHELPPTLGPDSDFTDYAKPLIAFIEKHPQSNWNSALHLNIGLGYYHAGYYSRAFPEFEKAWQLGRDATHPMTHLMVDRSVGELAKMHARVGHDKELEALFKDIGKRPSAAQRRRRYKGHAKGYGRFITIRVRAICAVPVRSKMF